MTVTLDTSFCQGATPAAAAANPTMVPDPMCLPVASALSATMAFVTYALGCSGGVTGSCAGGGVCTNPANQLCIYASGAQLCPSSFPKATVVYGAIDNNFACTPCTCGVSTPPTCTPTTTFYQDTACQVPLAPVLKHDGSCAVFGNMPVAARITDVGMPSGGACSVTGGGMLSGGATGTNPVTVCCMN
jgi:hypothetical protein